MTDEIREILAMLELECPLEFYVVERDCGRSGTESRDYTQPVTIHCDNWEIEELSGEEYEKQFPPIQYTCRDGTPVDEIEDGSAWTSEELVEMRKRGKELIARLNTTTTTGPLILKEGD